MPKWLQWIVTAGVVIDLGLSGWLFSQQLQVNANTAASAKSVCWDRVLDHAVTGHPDKAALTAQALRCRDLP